MRILTIAVLGLLCACTSAPRDQAQAQPQTAAAAPSPSYSDCAGKLSLWNPLSVVNAVACGADRH